MNTTEDGGNARYGPLVRSIVDPGQRFAVHPATWEAPTPNLARNDVLANTNGREDPWQ
jgi:hypothetical protein